MTRVRTPLFAALLILLTTPLTSAQTTAQLSGRVSDESGGVLPGVTVTATQTGTGFVRTAVTNENGLYVLAALPVGPYSIQAELSGFRTFMQMGVVLQIDAAPSLNIVMGVGGIAETVTIEASAPLVDVQSAGVGDVVTSATIMELPLEGRQVTSLLLISGAAVVTAGGGGRTVGGGVNISIAGGLSTGVSYNLDGAPHNNPQSGQNLPMPFPDALQEFRVANSGLSAQYGVHASGAVNAITKSGTNNLGGTAFEFLRHRSLNAKDRFASIGPDGERADDGLVRNQFGGVLGGPIIQNRLFFFAGYQGTALRSRPASSQAWVPTAAMYAGDFTAFTSPACNGGRQIALRAPFVNNRISPALFSPAGINMLKRFPAADDECGRITYTTSSRSDESQPIGRLDFNWADHSMFGRYMAQYEEVPPPYQGQGDNVLKATVNGTKGETKSLSLGDTLVLGTGTLNALRFAYNTTEYHRFNNPYFDPSDLGAKLHSYIDGVMRMRVASAFTYTGGALLSDFYNTSYQVADDVTLVRGNHQFGFGTTVMFAEGTNQTNARSNGNWVFDGRATGHGLADVMVGRVASLEHGSPVDLPVDGWYFGSYAQDTWRKDRLTFNYGVRWEPFFGTRVRNGAIMTFDLEDFRKGVRSQAYVNAPAGFKFPGDPGFPDSNTGINKQWWNFGPRAGVAWDVSGNGRTGVRASWALGYDFMPGDYHQANASSPPFGNRTLLTDPPGLMDNPYGHLPGGDPHPLLPNRNIQFVQFGAFGVMDPDINSPRVQNWNVTLEHQLGTQWGVSASYLGTYSDRLWSLVALNPGVYMGEGPCTLRNGVTYPVCSIDGNLDFRRVLYLENPAEAQYIGAMDRNEAVGWQKYHGLKLSAQRRGGDGLSLSGNYTLSRCVGTHTTSAFEAISQGFIKPEDPDYDVGFCNQDRRHIANLTAGIGTPDAGDGLLGALASDWRVAGIVSIRSGSRINILSGMDNAKTGQRNQRPNQVSDDIYTKTLDSWFNIAAFTQPANGTVGNVKRNSAVGPGFWNVDLAITRNIQIAQQHSFELRVEAFNALNHFNWDNPGDGLFGSGDIASLNAANFTRITTAANGPRTIQLGLKYSF